MTDFRALTHDQLAEFIVENQAELGCSGITVDDVMTPLRAGTAKLVAEEHCFAVVTLSTGYQGTFIPYLWLLFVSPSERDRGLGSRLMRRLLKEFSSDNHMSMTCFGARRRKFFGRHGFRIESRDGEARRMTTNDYLQ